jgi:hypothetical protein
MMPATSKRLGHGEGSIYWDESRKRYIGAVDLGPSPAGTRIRKKVSGKAKVEIRDQLRELHKEPDAGLSERTVTLYRDTIAKALLAAHCPGW